jgi:hypothetical protein
MSTELSTAIDLKAAFEDIKQLVLQGNAMQAFEKYYGEDVIMQENQNLPTVGKAANRQREEEFFAKVVEFRGVQVKNVAFGENVIISEWFLDYTHQDWGKRTYDQVSVQEWKDGKVVRERFYYSA